MGYWAVTDAMKKELERLRARVKALEVELQQSAEMLDGLEELIDEKDIEINALERVIIKAMGESKGEESDRDIQ